MTRLHTGMMDASHKYSEGQISLFRFILAYYSRLATILLLGRPLVIIDQASSKSLEETK